MSIASWLGFHPGTAPADPADGLRMYMKADGNMYYRDSSGVETRFTPIPPTIKHFSWIGSVGISSNIGSSGGYVAGDDRSLVWCFYLPGVTEFDTIQVRVQVACATNPGGSIALYSADGQTKYATFDGLDWTATGGKTYTTLADATEAVAKITLQPGWYTAWFACRLASARFYGWGTTGQNSRWRGDDGAAVADGSISPATYTHLVTGGGDCRLPNVVFYMDE